MSVAAFVKEPENLRKDGAMYTPVATEKFFYEIWFPIIEKLGLEWLSNISFGLNISNENLYEVLDELNKLRTWIQQSENSYKIGLIERITNLENMLKKAFEFENVVVYVG